MELEVRQDRLVIKATSVNGTSRVAMGVRTERPVVKADLGGMDRRAKLGEMAEL